MTASKAQSFIAAGGKAKKGIVPVVNGKYGFGIVCGHNINILLIR
jgi:hypothetical protein